jgi:hypothetical protein
LNYVLAALSSLKQTAATNGIQEVDTLRTLTVKKLKLVAPSAYLASMSFIHFVEIAAQGLLLVEDTFPW